MKRNIKDLKPNEAIQINTKKELKAISKLTFKPIATNAPCYYFKYNDEMNGFKTETNSNVIYPASDFIRKPKKSRLDRIEERLTKLEDAQPLSVTDNGNGDYTITGDLFKAKNLFEKYVSGSETELTQLPEKWCVKCSDTVRDWACSKDIDIIGSIGYYHNDLSEYPWYRSIQHGYTEITTEQFKKWVLGEEKLEKAIDWSKAGQFVISDDIVIETTGLHSSDAFSGVVVLGNNRYQKGHAINRWNKSKFKPYTGKL